MIHAFYCYDSDPHDRWFTDDIKFVDEAHWHLEKYFNPDSVKISDEMRMVHTKHFDGYEIALGGVINEPIYAILNNPAVWVPTSFLKLKDELVISLNGTEVYRG